MWSEMGQQNVQAEEVSIWPQNLPIPISQRSPASNGEHVQLKPFAVMLHVPPFKHGLLKHASVISIKLQ